MPEVTIYTKELCPYCSAAKALLTSKGVTYEEIDINEVIGARRTMIERAGGRTTVPQIFIDGQHVGGSDDLHALDAKGALDPMLKAA